MTALENQNAAFNELQKDAKEQLIQHRKEFDRLSKDIKKSDKLAERIAKLTKDLNTVKTEQRRSSKSTEELTDQLSIAQVQLNQQKSAMDSLIREKNGLIHQVNEIRDSAQLSVQEKELEIAELRHELRYPREDK